MNFTNSALNIINNTMDLMSGGGNMTALESNNESTNALTSAIVSNHIRNVFDTRPANGTHSIDLKNINVTYDELHDFAIKVLKYNQYTNHNRSHANESLACRYYCDGFFKDLLSSYKDMHGYISLAVSILPKIFHSH